MTEENKQTFDVEVFLSTVDGGRTISTYQIDQAVFSQGDVADSVFYIQDGKVKVTVLSDHGKEAVVAIMASGDFVGETCLTGQPRRIATASAMTESVIMRWKKQPLCACSMRNRNFWRSS